MLPLSQSKELIITQLTGDGRKLTLRGRSLPYQNPSFWCGKMNIEKTVYPGNPEATVQVLGSEETPTTLEGMWKDRYIDCDMFDGISTTTLNPKGKNLGLGNAMQLVEFINIMRLQGQRVSLSWGDIYEEGFLTEVKFNWLRSQDMHFTLDFEWVKPDIKPSLTATSGITKLDSIINDLNSAVSTLQSLTDDLMKAQGYLSNIIAGISGAYMTLVGNIAYTMSNILDVGTEAANLATLPLNLVARTISLFSMLSNQCAALIDQTNFLMTQYSNPSGWQDTQTYIYVEKKSADINNQALTISLDASNQANIYTSTYFAGGDMWTQYIAKDGDSLQKISEHFYGDSSYWTYLADINLLDTSQVDAGTVVLVPKTPQVLQ